MTQVLLATILLFLVLGTQTKGQTGSETCGRLRPSLLRLLINASETHHWPWHAAIYHQYNETEDPIYQCGGTVISSKLILTAAHCLCFNSVKLDVKIISVALGRLNLGVSETSGQSFKVSEIIVHPAFNSIDFANDIAIVKLSAGAEFNNYVQPICLWKSNEIDLSEVIGRPGTVVGWGLTEKNQLSNVLQSVSMPVVSWDVCLESNPDVFGPILSTRNFCAGRRNGTSVCQGDSGGSMTFEENDIYYIRGIVSLSPSKVNPILNRIVCDSKEYALFTDVAQYLPWISETGIRECEKIVQCTLTSLINTCSIVIQESDQKCKIIFDEATNDFRTLIAKGEFDVVKDFTDAVAKFRGLSSLRLAGVKLRIVDRFRLGIFKRQLAILDLSRNLVTQLDADTFYDSEHLVELDLNSNRLNAIHPALFSRLHKLSQLNLDNNQLKEVHSDLFKDLPRLTNIYLNGNRLEGLPEGLFRNNRKLRYIELRNNNITKILHSLQTSHMPDLVELNIY